MNKNNKTSYTSSLLSHTRKLSYELQRPLKRANSLKYRVLTPAQMQIPTSPSISSPSSPVDSLIEPRAERKAEPKTYYVRKMLKRRITSIKKLSPTPSLTAISKLTGPPESPNVSECDSESDSDASFFSNSSFDSIVPGTQNTSFNSNTVDSSPVSLRILKYHPFLHTELSTPFFSPPKRKPTCEIFEIPEILDLILHYVAVQQDIPSEPVMLRRAPFSRNHSVLIHGEQGHRIWEEQQRQKTDTTIQKTEDLTKKKRTNLHNCLLVNKSWYHTTQHILYENLYFKDHTQLFNFSQSNTTSFNIQPYSLILHKTKSTQSLVDSSFEDIQGSRLTWIEFYITPNVIPPMHLFTSTLQKLVIPGCRALTDDVLIEISRRARNLKHLDIRACDQITDASIYQLAANITDLKLFNCGRHKKGELISDVSIGQLIQYCPNLKTIGLAGCGITDWSIWELALNCSSLERLSLNNCWKLTDVGVCRALHARFFDKLNVLEVRNLRLNQVGDLVAWKKRKADNGEPILIEACERIDSLMNRWTE